MNQNLISLLDKLYNIVGLKNKKRLKGELVDFIAYLSSSDGVISEAETVFIEDYLGEKLNVSELKEYIEKNNIYSSEFEKTIPKTFESLVLKDKTAAAADKKYRLDTKSYIMTFEAFAKEFIVCDGDADENEVREMTSYLQMLTSHLEETIPDTKKRKASLDSIDVIVPDVNGKGDSEDLRTLLIELNGMIGLGTVKRDVLSLIHLQEIKRIRRERGLKDIPMSNHLVFYGNPGTGKTTVARLLARIYHAMGILSKGKFIEVDRSGLVAGYTGQTALKVMDVVKSAMGGVLFIDEAYSLARDEKEDFGQEAIDTLLKAMEDNRDDLIVIVAGYTVPMMKFVESNPGLKSRFNKYIFFEDYSVDELLKIFEYMCEDGGYTCDKEVLSEVKKHFGALMESKDKDFANAREVRNYFEKAIVRQADRLYGKPDVSDEELMAFAVEDLNTKSM